MRAPIRNILLGTRTVIPLILDTLSAAAAYSLRLLRTAYTGFCIRVRRSSDNTERPIGFVGGVLDTVDLLAFVGVGNGFIVTWYDQSGNTRDSTQATAANQPRIVNAGVLDLLNTTASAHFSGSNWLDFTSLNNLNTVSAVFKKDSSSVIVQYVVGGVSQGLSDGGIDYPNILAVNAGGIATSDVNTFLPIVATVVVLSGTANLFLDGVNKASSFNFPAFTLSSIGTRPEARSFAHYGKSSEIIFFNSNLSTADRQSLEANQKTYYGTP